MPKTCRSAALERRASRHPGRPSYIVRLGCLELGDGGLRDARRPGHCRTLRDEQAHAVDRGRRHADHERDLRVVRSEAGDLDPAQAVAQHPDLGGVHVRATGQIVDGGGRVGGEVGDGGRGVVAGGQADTPVVEAEDGHAGAGQRIGDELERLDGAAGASDSSRSWGPLPDSSTTAAVRRSMTGRVQRPGECHARGATREGDLLGGVRHRDRRGACRDERRQRVDHGQEDRVVETGGFVQARLEPHDVRAASLRGKREVDPQGRLHGGDVDLEQGPVECVGRAGAHRIRDSAPGPAGAATTTRRWRSRPDSTGSR